jgi:hypothetical protein
MNCHVIWLAPALDELAKIWLAAANRNSIAKASDEIDGILSRSPLEVGESREGFNRILIHGPSLFITWFRKPRDVCTCGMFGW